jgi:hypothetical protein
MRGNGRFTESAGEPYARCACVRKRFLGAESLRRDDEERARGIGGFERVRQIRAIDVRHEAYARRADREWMQGLHCHRGAEVRTSDADVDHGGEAGAGGTSIDAVAHAGGELEHAGALCQHLARDRLAAWRVRRDVGHSQRHMQHRTILGGVDRLTAPLGIDARSQSACFREIAEQAQALGVDALPREIEIEADRVARESLTSRGVRIAQRTQVDLAGIRGVRLQRPPGADSRVVSHFVSRRRKGG